MSVTIKVDGSELTQLATMADQLAGVAGNAQLLNAVGEVLQETVRGHFEALAGDTAHHKSATALGAERTGFYAEAAEKVERPQIEGESAVSVSVNHEGLAQRFYGGDISGQPFLTIPARAEAYGHRAREFENLQLIIFPSGSGALIAKSPGAALRGQRGPRGKVLPEKDKLDVFYWLVRQVHQEADPTVLPDEDEILDPAIEAAGAYVDILMQRSSAA